MNEDNKRRSLYLLLFGIVMLVIGAFLFGRYVFAKTNGEKAHAIIRALWKQRIRTAIHRMMYMSRII